MTALENRVRKLTQRMGGFDDKLRAMSDDELDARILAFRVADGFNTSLPRAEALAAYIAKLEAELPTLSGPEYEAQHQIIGFSREELRRLWT